jgi:hypothetical protein
MEDRCSIATPPAESAPRGNSFPNLHFERRYRQIPLPKKRDGGVDQVFAVNTSVVSLNHIFSIAIADVTKSYGNLFNSIYPYECRDEIVIAVSPLGYNPQRDIHFGWAG